MSSKKDVLEKLRKASRTYSDTSILMHEAIARKAGLTGTDHKYLGLILQKEEWTAGEIAQITNLTTGAVTGMIDRLEAKGLVNRKFDKTDRRKILVAPNLAATTELLTPLFADLHRKTTALLQTFSVEELQVIERYFNDATQIMNETINQFNKQ
ncbi:MAG: MarR family transcriptional regulator [Bacteroidetes bacterium]|nr:MarR family transcriptional regulator [Bacteroidota bacterium]